MSIIVEEGTGTNLAANSYVSEAELVAYAAARGITLTVSAEQLLIKAMDYIESLSYISEKKNCKQPLQWPRCFSYYSYNCCSYLEGIPKELKAGQMEAAIAISQGNDPLQDSPIGVKRKKLEGLEIEYKDGGSSVIVNKRILTSLRRLLASGGYQLPVRKG